MTQTFGEGKEGLEFPSEMLKASLQVLGVSVFPSFSEPFVFLPHRYLGCPKRSASSFVQRENRL